MAFIPSPFQVAIRDFIKSGSGSAIVEAVAGSGKTTTMVWALDAIPVDVEVRFLAFNTKIARELAARVPKHVEACTFHSAGLADLRRHRQSVLVEANKCRDLMVKHFSDAELEGRAAAILALVSKAKGAGVGALMPDRLESWLELAEKFDVMPEDGNLERACGLASELLDLSNQQSRNPHALIDFDDMLYVPLVEGMKLAQYRWIMVDEAQDVNAVQVALLRGMLAPGGRLVAVGDPHQAIYGFRGALSDSLKQLGEAFGCIRLPLSVCYRCAQSVVNEARTLVSHIEASPLAPIGEVVHNAAINGAAVVWMDKEGAMVSSALLRTDVILCRNTAPLVSLAYALIGRKVGCKVLGREIGAGLVSLIRLQKAKGVDALLVKLERWADREAAKFVAKGQEQKAEAVRDRVACISTVVESLDENHRTVPEVIRSIEGLFSDDAGGRLTLCTAHKSKGLEWDRVILFRPDLMPSKYARQQWQQEQEVNLQYVAYTRAKNTLIICG
jgi:DNA helicase II / ATP-dependent DNA helicase PcrA